MKKIEFKSQICTSRSQSEKLLALGLKKETADMVYITDKNVLEEYRRYELVPEYYESCFEDIEHIPAWSLHRLMEIAYTGDILGYVALNFHERNIGAYYEQVIKVIEYLIRIKEFNTDYLEEKK